MSGYYVLDENELEALYRRRLARAEREESDMRARQFFHRLKQARFETLLDKHGTDFCVALGAYAKTATFR